MNEIDKIVKFYEKGYSRTELLKKLRDKIKNIPDFNIREKAQMYRTLKNTTVLIYVQEGKIYASQRKVFESGIRKIQDRNRRRKNKQNLVKSLRESREQGEVFYLCTAHEKCALDHRAYQGKIYVDRYWRETLRGDYELLREVGAYITNHDVKTVQWVCGAPVYMTTRPFCKHRLIPVPISEVLNSSVNKIIKDHRAYGKVIKNKRESR